MPAAVFATIQRLRDDTPYDHPMQFVPPTHEQTPIRCSSCHERYVSFLPVHPPLIDAGDYAPDRCACGHLENPARLPPGMLFGDDDAAKSYHPISRPN